MTKWRWNECERVKWNKMRHMKWMRTKTDNQHDMILQIILKHWSLCIKFVAIVRRLSPMTRIVRNESMSKENKNNRMTRTSLPLIEAWSWWCIDVDHTSTLVRLVRIVRTNESAELMVETRRDITILQLHLLMYWTEICGRMLFRLWCRYKQCRAYL